MARPTPIERFQRFLKPDPSGCILWAGGKTKCGYGVFRLNGRQIGAHCAALLLSGIEIPSGHEVDHVCRVRHCVNERHLRVVTHRTNVIENSAAPTALNAAKTHCKNGHPFSEENTYRRPGGVGRDCQQCKKAVEKRRVRTPNSQVRP